MDYTQKAQKLVEESILPQGVSDPKVLNAFLATPRHKFVPGQYQNEAYFDIALPISYGQTISQPSLVALMTQSLNLKGNEKVLEIGTGSGYQAAILSHLVKDVYTVEILPQLAKKAQKTLIRLGYKNVHISKGNGTIGLEKFAPFDAIIVSAGGKEIPQPLIDQLKVGGRIIIPIGASIYNQRLTLGIKKPSGLEIKTIEPVAFVPLIGKYGWQT